VYSFSNISVDFPGSVKLPIPVPLLVSTIDTTCASVELLKRRTTLASDTLVAVPVVTGR
jgi:hypothetical protein